MMDPLPRCLHGNCLLDNADERLEPPCGCRYGFAVLKMTLHCKWCGQEIYEGLPEGRRRFFAHSLTHQPACQRGALNAYGNWKGNHIAFPINDRIETTPTNKPDGEGWRTWGMVELAIRNPNVKSYMEHWEARALKAEKALAEIAGIDYSTAATTGACYKAVMLARKWWNTSDGAHHTGSGG